MTGQDKFRPARWRVIEGATYTEDHAMSGLTTERHRTSDYGFFIQVESVARGRWWYPHYWITEAGPYATPAEAYKHMASLAAVLEAKERAEWEARRRGDRRAPDR
jgi:hypothetical protein